MSLEKTELNTTNIPRHIALIMDGNGRWAKQRGEHRLFGHTKGVDAVREVLKAAKSFGVEFLTLYAFSTENWNRPQEEVNGLMNLLVDSITNELPELQNQGVKLLVIGDLKGLPENCQLSLAQGMASTKNNKEITLILALNYSAKWEITQCVREISLKVAKKDLDINEITPDLISCHLTTKEVPDPELLIRTSGEHRISNFLLWQLAYAEFYFTDIHWPDFGKEELKAAIISYQSRERRFGMVSEQLSK
jgi:undecaprenyl diphosphate synthase